MNAVSKNSTVGRNMPIFKRYHTVALPDTEWKVQVCLSVYGLSCPVRTHANDEDDDLSAGVTLPKELFVTGIAGSHSRAIASIDSGPTVASLFCRRVRASDVCDGCRK